MDLGLSGKRALVLASSQGLGLGIAARLCAEGANVMLSGRSTDKLADAAMRLTASGPGKACWVEMDLAQADAAGDLFRSAEEQLGSVDILVNNTGGPPPGSVDKPDSAQWREQFDMMVLRVMEISKLCLANMQAQGWGRILTVASSGVIQPIPNLAMSNTLRAALVGWNKSLANEVAARGVTANILAPGRIHTTRIDELNAAMAIKLGKPVEEVAAASIAAIPAGRLGTVEEFGAVAAFLVSEPASYINGSVVRCDGGAIRSV